MIRFYKTFSAILLLSLGMQLSMVHADETKKTKVKPDDYISMAAMLVKDGLYQRALMALENIDVNTEGLDLSRFYTLQGLAFLNLEDLKSAKNSLEKAVSSGQTDPVIYIYLAQTYYPLKEFAHTIEAIKKAGNASQDHPAIMEMLTQSYWELQDYDHAFAALDQAIAMFPKDYRFLRRKVFYLVDLGLYKNAAELGLDYLSVSDAQVKDYIAIGNALRLSHQYTEALRILEVAKLKFPAEANVAKVLAHTYMDQGQLFTAAQIFEQGAIYNPELFAEAGEVYRRAGRFYRALDINKRIVDAKVKLKQRLALYLALKRFDAAANMQKSLYRQGLLEDEAIRYALAYAYFNIGEYQKSEQHLDHLKDPELFKKGVELRRVIGECQQNPAQCA